MKQALGPSFPKIKPCLALCAGVGLDSQGCLLLLFFLLLTGSTRVTFHPKAAGTQGAGKAQQEMRRKSWLCKWIWTMAATGSLLLILTKGALGSAESAWGHLVPCSGW